MTHLIIFTIGPVQSFIAQARKTQDLFAGSRLLSDLARVCYELLKKQTGNDIELIFPAFYDDEGISAASNPNRFAAKISGKTVEQISTACRNTKNELTERFVKMAEEHFNKMHNYSQIQVFLKAQLENLLEIYWAAIDFDTSNYHDQYSKLESYLGGIKDVRPFNQLEEQGRKCNVDGIRNAMFYKHSIANGQENPKPIAIQNPYCHIPKSDTRLTPGEGLSAVSMFKRLAKEEKDFPSTAKIALMELIDNINKVPEQKELLEKYIKLFKKKEKVNDNWDEQLLFEENLTEKYFEYQGLSEIVKEQGGIDSIVKEYINLIKSTGNFTPSYYAIFVFDGDSMGEWISGDKLVSPSMLYNFQKKTGDLLREFGTWAVSYLNEPRGKAVYSGGDDFLGFINLHHLYDVLITMRTKFDEMINLPLQNEKELFQLKPGNTFSFSAGISIAHYKQPLGLVLDEARKAEQLAKKNPGKNSWAISVIRHSGGTTTCVQPFGNEYTKSLTAMKFIGERLGNNFSNKFIFNLKQETRYWIEKTPREIFITEAKRLIKRAKSQGIEEETVNTMAHNLEILLGTSDFTTQEIIENVTSSLRICDFIYRCIKTEEKHEYA